MEEKYNGRPPNSSLLDVATKNSFPLFFAGGKGYLVSNSLFSLCDKPKTNSARFGVVAGDPETKIYRF